MTVLHLVSHLYKFTYRSWIPPAFFTGYSLVCLLQDMPQPKGLMDIESQHRMSRHKAGLLTSGRQGSLRSSAPLHARTITSVTAPNSTAC